jgi:hypothetical protein
MILGIDVPDCSELDARDWQQLAELLRAALLAQEHGEAWEPMCRARLLVARARLLEERGR